ncbi:MAG: multiheme c-type cytochrome [Candidatus Neomarinimicrobiota bacterium]
MLIAQEALKVESAITCKMCHLEIYNDWSNSQHARSTPEKNILFANIYRLSQEETQSQTKLYCIRCHAPVSQINGDVDLKMDITNEGVTCDICHSIRTLTDHPDNWPNIYEPGAVKRGPNRETNREIKVRNHEIVFSDLFENSRLCSGCHGDMLDIPGTRSCGNLTICDTDFEWQGTAQAVAGKSCVNCHMVGAMDQITVKKKEKHFQHDFSGAYSPAMLQQAVDLTLDIKEFENEIIANVEVVNVGAAHLVPTGPPARMAFVKITALDKAETVVWSNFIENPVKEDPFGVFHIVFANLEGKVPSMPWLASRIVKDTRLRPGETRNLVYKLPASGVEKVVVKLFYRLAPPPLLDRFEITDETLKKAYLMAQVETFLPIQ